MFGEVAELYDAARPTYPDALIDDLTHWARIAADPPGAGSALEVGAGTGKATRLLAARGVAVMAIEPSAEMAAVAERTTAGARASVTVLQTDFEHAELGEQRFPLVFAAQAWHWVSQPAGYARARARLLEGGRLVVFWNRPRWEDSTLREDLNRVYEAHVPPELRGGPLHPAPREASVFSGQDWEAEIVPVAGFADPEVREYEWAIDYTADGYTDMLNTISEVRLLAEAERERFLSQMHAEITGHGAGFTLAMQSRTCIARAV